VNLTSGNGIAAVEEICRDKDIPVVFITSAGEEVARRRPGAFVAPKPLTEDTFVAIYQRAIAGFRPSS
jgi:hypothetical protein